MKNEIYYDYFSKFKKYFNSHNYMGMFKYLDILLSDECPYKNEVNYYLFLISFVFDVPSKYKEYIDKLRFDDIMSDDSIINKIRDDIFRRKYISAFEKLNLLGDTATKSSEKDIISSLIDRENNFKYKLLNLIRVRDYKKVLDYLHENRDFLSKYYMSIFLVSLRIMDIINGKYEVKKSEGKMASTLFDAIELENFDLALKFSNKYNMEHQINANSNPLHLVLKDILYLLNHTKEESLDYLSISELSQDDLVYASRLYQSMDEYNSVVILDSMSEDKVRMFVNYFSQYNDITIFVFDDEEKEFIMLKKKINIPDRNLYFQYFIDDYESGNYEAAIRKANHLIGAYVKPKVSLFVKLGKMYLKMEDYISAIKYLKVATALRDKKKDNKRNNDDYSYLINKLKELIYAIPKPSDDFGIQYFEQFRTYIIVNNVSFMTACEAFNLSPEEINIVRLLYARDYYTAGYYAEGDSFVKAVYETKNKSDRVLSILKEVRSKRKFYKNNSSENVKKLKLGLKPKK